MTPERLARIRKAISEEKILWGTADGLAQRCNRDCLAWMERCEELLVEINRLKPEAVEEVIEAAKRMSAYYQVDREVPACLDELDAALEKLEERA